MNKSHNDENLTMVDLVKTTFAAALGVQSNKNRERDFKHGNIKVFAIAGLIFTVLFIAILICLAKLVLYFSGM
ncbi:DUF2970 domain-containing protein [Haliea salexigens]|uniref:DUF2970 domain-containing protein n=1 Tax=Haliea salexigens TaxID=287487 RepID=UPI00047F61B5|nr:DUF2970 domain-containing protein [Haliea salexigens]